MTQEVNCTALPCGLAHQTGGIFCGSEKAEGDRRKSCEQTCVFFGPKKNSYFKDGNLATASTCGPLLSIPYRHGTYESFNRI